MALKDIETEAMVGSNVDPLALSSRKYVLTPVDYLPYRSARKTEEQN